MKRVFIYDDRYCCIADTKSEADRIFVKMTQNTGNKDLYQKLVKKQFAAYDMSEEDLREIIKKAFYDLVNKFDAPIVLYADSLRGHVELADFISEHEHCKSERFDVSFDEHDEVYSMNIVIGDKEKSVIPVNFMEDGEYIQETFIFQITKRMTEFAMCQRLGKPFMFL